jgi:enamine deaminase RidA (YjgF/YER057c/UK114 family)
MNDVYRTYFPTNPPARSCIEVKNLAREGLEIEIECVAAI